MIDHDHDRTATLNLIERAGLSAKEIRRAERRSDADQITLADALLSLGLVSAKDLAISRARVRDLPFVDLDAFEINPANADLISLEIAARFDAFPLFVLEGVATVGMADPTNPVALDRVRRAVPLEVEPVLCEPAALRAIIARACQTHQHAPDNPRRKSA